MKPETIATKLAEIVSKRKIEEAKIKAVSDECAEDLAAAKAALDAVQAKVTKRTAKTSLVVAELASEEKELREKLLDPDLIGITFPTIYGRVSVEANPTPVVKRFTSVPLSFRKDPNECILSAKVRKAFKDGENVPGVNMIDFPKVVVR